MAKMQIYRVFTFEAAHSLPHVPPQHKCRRIHGHSYRVTLYLEGEVDPQLGWVEDFGTVKDIAGPVIRQLDHRYLNDIPGLENPTAEHIARWLWKRIKPLLPLLTKIEVAETPRSGCIYEGEE